MRRFVAGNWKMHGLQQENAVRARAIASSLARAGLLDSPNLDIALFPPLTSLAAVAAVVPDVLPCGVQDVHAASSGAFTGSISAEMAADAGARYAIVGHSERRHGLGETAELVAAKLVAALRMDLLPVLCVGETAAERDAGEADQVVRMQLAAVRREVAATDWQSVVVAYEPVWAIGTGRRASADQVVAMHAVVHRWLAAEVGVPARVVYGGSVTAANAAELFAIAGVDGALVGGASLSAEDFVAICRAAAEAAQGDSRGNAS